MKPDTVISLAGKSQGPLPPPLATGGRMAVLYWGQAGIVRHTTRHHTWNQTCPATCALYQHQTLLLFTRPPPAPPWDSFLSISHRWTPLKGGGAPAIMPAPSQTPPRLKMAPGGPAAGRAHRLSPPSPAANQRPAAPARWVVSVLRWRTIR